MEVAWHRLILNLQIMFKYKKNSLQVEIPFSSGTCFGKVYSLSSLCFWHFFLSEISFSVLIQLVLGFLLCSIVFSVDPYAQSMLSWIGKVLWYIEIRYCDVIRFFSFAQDCSCYLKYFVVPCEVFLVVLMMSLGIGILILIVVSLQTVGVVGILW